MRESDIFERLRPHCVQLAKQYSFETLCKIREECETFERDQQNMQMLQHYLIFPVRVTLKTRANQNTSTECINFLTYVFQHTRLTTWNLFSDVMEQIFYYFRGTTTVCEELRLAVCECAQAMLDSASMDVLDHIYSNDFCISLAQYIYTLLEMGKNESYKALQYAALKALAAFMYCSKPVATFDASPTSLYTKAGNKLASFLPGVSIALCKIICGDVKQSHSITVLAIDLFSRFIALTVGDVFTRDQNSMDEEKRSENELISVVKRNETWIRQISNNLEVLVRRIAEVASHEHWRVRIALANCAGNMLSHCASNLSNCISPLLQMLFALSVDEYEEVNKTSHNVIADFSQHIISVKAFDSILEEDIFAISSKLIKIYLLGNDRQMLMHLKVLHGYFQLLGRSVNNLLYSFPHLDRFLTSLLNLIRFDTSDLNFLAEHFPTSDYQQNCARLWPKWQFKHFHDQEIVSRISAICQLLGQNGNIELLIDYLLDKLNSNYKNESLFLIGCILKSLNPVRFPLQKYYDNTIDEDFCLEEKVSKHIVSLVLESLLTLDIWTVSFNDYCKSSDDNPETLKENILQVCLILRCITISSQVQLDNFQLHLVDVLCGVMEKAGCNNQMISHVGKLALYTVSQSCGYDSVTDLIVESADYLVDSIAANLMNLSSHSETVVVLHVIVENCSKDVLSLFRDPIYKMLKTLDRNQNKALVIMKVLKSVVMAVQRWFPAEVQNANQSKMKSSHSSLRDCFLERHRLKQIEMSPDENEDSESDTERNSNGEAGSDFVETENEKPPLHVEIVSAILERCVHLMSSQYLELTILTLDVIGASIVALKNDIDKALPYVHKIWSPLVCQFSKNLVISMKAFQTLVVIANECGDFVKSRTMKDVWPKILVFLKSQATVSMSKGNSSNYSMTTAFKLQHLLLLEIGNMANKLELTEKELELLNLHCLPYLNVGQPDLLQVAAKKSIESLSTIDPDAAWFHFHQFYGMKNPLTPSNPMLMKPSFVPHTSNKIGSHCPNI